jgi:hypothetical protein
MRAWRREGGQQALEAERGGRRGAYEREAGLVALLAHVAVCLFAVCSGREKGRESGKEMRNSKRTRVESRSATATAA